MAVYQGTQLSLIAEDDFVEYDYCDWSVDTRPDPITQRSIAKVQKFLDDAQKLGTNDLLVPNSGSEKLGTNDLLVPNFSERWKPPVGCLDLKVIKKHHYWCWRYYDNHGKKRSIHLDKDYNKAIVKALLIGLPPDARTHHPVNANANSQKSSPTSANIISNSPTAYCPSRSAIAA
jgi:hypothetical protein